MNSFLLDRHLAQTTPFPVGLEVSHASGSYIHTTDGKKYLDFISGLAVTNLGHGNKAVKEAVALQLEKHAHVMVYGEYEQNSTSQLAKNLTDQLPTNLDTCYFVNSGTEAIEASIKLCRRATGKSEIIAFKGSYHGATTGSLAISYNEEKKYAVRPLMPDVKFIELNNFDDLSKVSDKTAGVFLETIQGDAGIRIPETRFMKALRARCTETASLLILDEIQTGMGRTGKLFAFEHFDIEPDILCLGKALGAGLPFGAMISNRVQMEKLTFDPMLGHITTFGGNPVICAAANAGLQELLKPDIISTVQKKGDYIFNSLSKHFAVKKVRYKGLFMAIELKSPESVQKVFDYCLAHGVLTFWFLSCTNAFRLAPPLNISQEDLEFGVKVILEALEQAYTQTI